MGRQIWIRHERSFPMIEKIEGGQRISKGVGRRIDRNSFSLDPICKILVLVEVEALATRFYIGEYT